MNILVLAAGTGNRVVQYFKKAFEGVGTVIAADAGALGPAIYDAVKHYIVPKITEPGYIDVYSGYRPVLRSKSVFYAAAEKGRSDDGFDHSAAPGR